MPDVANPSMDSDPLRRLLASFDELLDLAADQRAERLRDLERLDPQAAADLSAMLQADSRDQALELERPFLKGAADPDREVAAGREIGPYRVLRRLGRGGMGEVYLATRSHHGFEQSVALKLLRRELVTPQAIERFHRESRIQARLDHPGIVPLIDAGVAPDGRPFLALLYVDGRPITVHADAERLTIAARLRLVIECCQAVAAAHARLVIHRDLKPSNILIAADGSVRLLDFGISKVLGEDEEGDLTRHAPAPMTPERAAPEQLRGEPSTTATDVWGLGVLLYELVTGRLPFDVRGRSPREIEREILERGPTRPSHAVAAGEEVAGLRSTTVRRLGRELGGDLEAVISCALAAEPERRYPSVTALAEDLERVLVGRPVTARPESVSYRVRRFVGRHRWAVTASSLAGLGILSLAVAIAVQSIRVARERDRATALDRQSTAVVELLIELFGATAPNRGTSNGDISIDQLLTQGAAKAEELRDSPEVRRRMFATLGRIRMERSELHAGLELLAKARRLADDAGVPPLDEDRLDLELAYTAALERLDDNDAARTLLLPLVARLEERATQHPSELAEALTQLALLAPPEDGPALAERALAIRRGLVPAQPVEVASSLDTLATLAFRRGERGTSRERWREALAILERELGERDLRTLSTLNNLAVVTPDPAEQVGILRRLLAIQEQLLGVHSGPVSNLWNNIGVAEAQLGHYAEAERALRQSHGLRVEVLGIDHRETVGTERNLARILELGGRYLEALELFDDVLARLPTTGVPPAARSAFAAQRAAVLWRLGRGAAAERELQRAIAAMRANLPAGHEDLSTALLLAARMANERGDGAGATRFAREAAMAREAQLPAGHPKRAEAQAELGRALVATGDVTAGRGLLRAALPTLEDWGLLHPTDRAALLSAASDGGEPQ